MFRAVFFQWNIQYSESLPFFFTSTFGGNKPFSLIGTDTIDLLLSLRIIKVYWQRRQDGRKCRAAVFPSRGGRPGRKVFQ
jgi:hypothetical protein